MMRELIEYAISMDGIITAARTGYILQNVSAVSEDEFGVLLEKGDVLHLYITGTLDTLTEMEACCARLLIEKYKRKFTDNLLRLVMKHAAEDAGRIYGSSGDFAREIMAYFEANGGTSRAPAEVKRSGFGGKRRSGEMSELSALWCGNEGYEARNDAKRDKAPTS